MFIRRRGRYSLGGGGGEVFMRRDRVLFLTFLSEFQFQSITEPSEELDATFSSINKCIFNFSILFSRIGVL